MKKDDYYNLMGNMHKHKDFKRLHKDWMQCFNHILKSFNCGFTNKCIESLYYDFDMDNWKAMHKENSEYKDCNKDELIENFVWECAYIADRVSYDRLFRTHWIFRHAFEDELNKIRFPLFYDND